MNAPARHDSAPALSHIDGIDLLRGLAILFVLLNHVNMRLLEAKIPYTDGLPDQLVYSLVWNGQFGVQMFFAISGFLITATTLRRWGSLDNIHVRGFYIRRAARIDPLLLLLLAALSILHLAHLKQFVIAQTTGGLGWALVAALTFHINLLEAQRGYLPASWDILWSLSVEEMFYLFFPLLCRFLGRGKLLTILLLLFVAIGPFARAKAFNHNPVWREYSYLGGMDAIALGCLTAIASARARISGTRLRILAAAGAVLLIFSLGFSIQAYKWGFGRNGINMTILATGTCLLILAAAQTGWKAPRLLMPLLTLGKRSYEVYLTHIFIVLGLFGVFMEVGKRLKFVPLLFLSVIAIAALLGEVVARAFSEPLNRRLRKSWEDPPPQKPDPDWLTHAR